MPSEARSQNGRQRREEHEWDTFTTKLNPAMTKKLDAQADSLGISRIALMRIIIAKHYGEF